MPQAMDLDFASGDEEVGQGAAAQPARSAATAPRRAKKAAAKRTKAAPEPPLRKRPAAAGGRATEAKRARTAPAAVIKVGHDFCGIQAPLQALENAQVKFEHVFSADSNKFCQAITQKFFPPTSCFYEDVLSRDNKSAPYVDLLVFGPPCQPWSSAGLGGGLKDYKDRGVLLFASLSYIKAQRPKCFVMEEVASVARQKKHKQAFSDLLAHMRGAGCTVSYKVLDTLNHGLPQSRPRLYVVGIRQDCDSGIFKFPASLAPPVDLSRILPRKSASQVLKPSDMTKSSLRNYTACAKDAASLQLDMDKDTPGPPHGREGNCCAYHHGSFP